MLSHLHNINDQRRLLSQPILAALEFYTSTLYGRVLACIAANMPSLPAYLGELKSN